MSTGEQYQRNRSSSHSENFNIITGESKESRFANALMPVQAPDMNIERNEKLNHDRSGRLEEQEQKINQPRVERPKSANAFKPESILD